MSDVWKLLNDCRKGEGTQVLFDFEAVQELLRATLDRTLAAEAKLAEAEKNGNRLPSNYARATHLAEATAIERDAALAERDRYRKALERIRDESADRSCNGCDLSTDACSWCIARTALAGKA